MKAMKSPKHFNLVLKIISLLIFNGRIFLCKPVLTMMSSPDESTGTFKVVGHKSDRSMRSNSLVEGSKQNECMG